MKKRFIGLLATVIGTMSLSACSLLDDLINNLPSGENEPSGGGKDSSDTKPDTDPIIVDDGGTSAHEGPHDYNGETCNICGRDIMLDYIEKFQTHGNSSTDYIILDSEQELISLNNYAHLNRVEKFFKCNYLEPSTNMKTYLENVFAKATDASCIRSYGFGSNLTGRINYSETDFESNYRLKSGSDYTEMLYEEYENGLDELFLSKGNRSNTFDNFKIYNRLAELTCKSGDDLFYACTHGYKPKVVAGSNAEQILNKVKVILRNIIDDSMNNVEKLFAMYCWLVKNVQYDNGAVVATDYGTLEFVDVAAWGIEGSVFEGKAICDSFSKTFAVFAGMEDIKCIQVSGNSHAWNKVYLNINGSWKWYVVDATFANGSSDHMESSTHDEFLYSDEIKEGNGYHTDNYLDCPASVDINQYELIKYDDSHDLLIESDSELRHYVEKISSYVKALHNEGKKVSIEVATPNSGANKYEPSPSTIRNVFKDYLGWEVGMSYGYLESSFNGYTVTSYQYE